jgi:cobalt-zinc-cadmium efflux system outer membrane protein
MLSKLRALPDVEFFASAQRIQEAELRLTQAERHRDIEWQLGVRRLNADSATAFVAGVSVPLGQSDRVDLRASADRARQQSLAAEGSQRLLELETVLIRAHGELVRDSEYLRIMDNEILPRLQRGVAQGAVALAAGAMTYMELAQIQRELLGAQRARLQSQVNIYRGWVEIQRLTGELWVEPAQSGGKQ